MIMMTNTTIMLVSIIMMIRIGGHLHLHQSWTASQRSGFHFARGGHDHQLNFDDHHHGHSAVLVPGNHSHHSHDDDHYPDHNHNHDHHDDQVRDCPPAPGHSAVLVPGQWELKEAEKRRTEVILMTMMKMLMIMKMMMMILISIIVILKRIEKNDFSPFW